MVPEAALNFSLTTTRELKRLYKESLVTKRYLVRVCKEWSVWASPYLYECIYLGRGRCLRPIRDALMKSHQQDVSSDEGYSLGWWTRRLDIAMRDISTSEAERREEINSICDIIHCLPNLSIVTFSVTAPPFHHNFQSEPFPSSILRVLGDPNGPSLQAIIWQCGCFTPDPNDWLALLTKATNIVTLRCPDFPEGAQLPELRHLEVLYPRKEPLPTAVFPSLRHLIADVSPSNRWYPLLKIHGEKLQVIQLSFKYHSTIMPVLSMISTSCPSLARLDLSVTNWELVGCQVEGCELVLPPTVQILGLQNTAKQSSDQGYRSLFLGLALMTFTSSLDYVQLIDSGNVKDLCQKHSKALMRGLLMLEAKGLHLRDHECLSLTITEEVNDALTPAKLILECLLKTPDNVSPEDSPLVKWVRDAKKDLRKMLVPYAGGLTISERAQIAHWFELN
ncbi:hypothetical protein DXG03_000525, partial [Asterophora parasitica]